VLKSSIKCEIWIAQWSRAVARGGRVVRHPPPGRRSGGCAARFQTRRGAHSQESEVNLLRKFRVPACPSSVGKATPGVFSGYTGGIARSLSGFPYNPHPIPLG